MKIPFIVIPIVVLVSLFTFSGCTVHPKGEREERQSALQVGKIYEKPVEKRDIPPLPSNPTPDDLVRYALLTNADVEQQYWQWRAAIEQITIDGTQPTNLAFSLSTTLNHGDFSPDRTILTASNDPMTDIVWPSKLSTAARRSLDNASAAGLRYRKAQFELRRKVLDAYEDYAANAKMIQLAQANLQLLHTTVAVVDARNRSGAGGQPDILKTRNAIDLAENDIDSMKSRLPIERAALNALLNLPPDANIPVPASLLPSEPLAISDQQLLDLATKANPELLALTDEIRARHEDIHLARLQYYPDFDVAASTDLKGITQTFLGQFTVPILRYEALHAAVAQAQANLSAIESMRRQTNHNLAAQLIDDIATLRDADRQVDLLTRNILPRARQSLSVLRSSYQVGSTSLLDLIIAQQSLIDLQQLVIKLQVTRENRLTDLESINGKFIPAIMDASTQSDSLQKHLLQ